MAILTVLEKIKKQRKPTIFFADVDGTIFTAGWKIVKAPFYNIQTSGILRENHVPFILVTGRPYWTLFSDCEMLLHGLFFADAVIAAAGTIILQRKTNGSLEKDRSWETLLSTTNVKRKNEKAAHVWNADEIEQYVKKYCDSHNFSFLITSENKFIVRITALDLSVQKLQQIITDFTNEWIDGIHMVTTEKLLKNNSLEVFSGDIIITPKQASKEGAIKYLLEKYATIVQENIHACIFGDASIDIGMLSMEENKKNYSLTQYGVHMTTLAKMTLLKRQQKNKNIYILENEGPQVIVQIVKAQYLNKQIHKTENDHFSPAQNNKARILLQPFEQFLNVFIDKQLTPNEISFLGLIKTQQGLEKIYKKKDMFSKLQGLQECFFGSAIDIFDGIRARQTKTFAENGQLVDVFCDRVKEFYQLFERAKRRIDNKKFEEGYQTLYSSISCILPSIARAQAEVFGNVVNERDAKGGSMFDRTKKLFFSLFFDAFGDNKKSLTIDIKIYKTNIATYENRMRSLGHSEPIRHTQGKLGVEESQKEISNTTNVKYPISNEERIEHLKFDDKQLNDFQKKALERFLLLVEILQDENEIISHFLEEYPKLLEQYTIEMKKYNEYLSLSVKKLREKYDFKNYDFSIKKFID